MTSSSQTPQHVAIIMDGNGRWAKKRHFPTIAGHRAGAETVKSIAKHAITLGIKYLTLYTFSSENWQREQSWIEDFMGLLKWYLSHDIKQLMDNDIRILVIGNRELLSSDIQKLILEVEKKTKNNQAITMILAISYSGRDEIIRSIKMIANKVKTGEIDPNQINPDFFQQHLDTKDIPDPDLLIRTSGEQRISNYLLWQMAYTEFSFTSALWPDFSVEEFETIVKEFHQRKRRYGLYD